MNQTHHIIPKHEWKERFTSLEGYHASDNKVVLSIVQHAEAHQWLYETYHRWGDHLASQMLRGQLTKDEGRRIAAREANIGRVYTSETKEKIRLWHSGRKLTDTHKSSIQRSCAGIHQGADNPFFGRKHSSESITKIKQARAICPVCGIETVAGNIARWHGIRCRKNTKC